MEQVPFFTEFGEDNFADNPEPRCQCLLLLDVSGSMQGRPLDQLNMQSAKNRRHLLYFDDK